MTLGGIFAVTLWLATAAPVSAHALLIASTPRDGEIVGAPPKAVILEFSERLNPRLSSAAVSDPSGHRWEARTITAREIRIPLATNAAGVYVVDWSATSLDDGHHTSGFVRFGVRTSPASVGGATGATAQPTPTDLLISVAKWIEALALLALIGQLVVAALAGRSPPLRWVRVRWWLASIALTAGVIAIWAEVAVATGDQSLSAEWTYFTSGISGIARLARLGCEALVVLTAVRRSQWIWAWTTAALIGVAASGHAADVEPAWSGIVVDSVHLLAAGCWAGGIIALATQRPPGAWRSVSGIELLRRFTPVALVAFGVTVLLGAVQAAQQLGSASALVTTAYGNVLIAKIVLVGCMLPLSWFAWRRRRPRLRVEASIASAVIAAASVLSAFPLPPTEATREAALRAATPSTAGRPASDDLTLTGRAGTVLVRLSLEPGRLGRDRVLVYLAPPEGSAAATALVATLITSSGTTSLSPCSSSCRQAVVSVIGGEELRVDVLNPGGGEATFMLPELR